ncbi:hypothetical protein [Novosphingobium sediminicola]|uniref:Uncharacterized protein n=1 Tax=Novosphingobium sediminicola TaxID=563162 RepID=A0A7W6CS93_9SPHN|nr:hypothetical protein [Novosphingobium sediminicola]MBB3956857.1 hypothetical protein [Novosphingobium sediminicola]
MTEAQDLFARLGFDQRGRLAPQPAPAPASAPAATLSEYICDLFVKKLTDDQLGQRRASGAYRTIRPAYLKGYHQAARGK